MDLAGPGKAAHVACAEARLLRIAQDLDDVREMELGVGGYVEGQAACRGRQLAEGPKNETMVMPVHMADDPVPLDEREADVVTRLRGYLREVLDIDGPIEVRRFPGGRANLTYEVRAGEVEFVVRRPPFGVLPPKAHDMEREYRVMSALSRRLPFVPQTYRLCSDRAVIGAPFFVMERIHGYVLRDRWPPFLPDDPGLRARIAESFLSTMVELHSLDPADVGLGSLGRPEGFMARQVKNWAERWRHSATRGDSNADTVFAWLLKRRFPGQPPAIVHNDLKLENVMLGPGDAGSVRAVLDWDMSTLGDPLADVGLLLAYWGQRKDDPTMYGGSLPLTCLEGFPERTWITEEYARRTMRDLSAIRAYHVFGLAKLATLCEQLLRRYRDGETDDSRLAGYEIQVPALWLEAHRLVETDT